MPIYEYQCEQCDEHFEKLVRSSTKTDEITCPKCGSGLVRKALSLFGFAGGNKTSGSSSSAGSSCGPT